jgi:hypothetical protein
MSLVANIAPPTVVLLVCVVAYISVRRGHRKGRDRAPLTGQKAEPAE